MRHNLLLHFLNRHAREIVGLPDNLKLESDAGRFLTQAFLTAILLSESAAVMPPGFFLESDIGFEIISRYPEFISFGLIELPMRELRIGDMIEKKRIEYAPARNEFRGLYDDKRLKLFDEITPSFIDRATKIGITATERWEAGPDADENWKEILATLTPEAVEIVRHAPRRLRDDGAALTWPALTTHLNKELLYYQDPVRTALQQNYFELYVLEYDLGMMHQLSKFDRFIPIGSPCYYPYRTFVNLLGMLGLDFIFSLGTHELMYLRLQPGWSSFVDAFVQLASYTDFPPANIRKIFNSAPNEIIVKRLASSLRADRRRDKTIAIAELTGELGYMANDVSRRFGLYVRPIRPSPELLGQGLFRAHRSKGLVLASEDSLKGRHMKNVFIITSNENENRAVLNELRSVAIDGKLISDVSMSSELSKVSARVHTLSGTVSIDVVIARETGGSIAANLLRRRIQNPDFPDAVFVIGCAGLLAEKYNLSGQAPGTLPKGLVILAKKASDGDARLVEDKGSTSRGDGFHGDRRLIEALRTLNGIDAFEPEGITLVTNREFISTSAFIASANNDERRRLVDQFISDAIVVENEAFAIYDEIQNIQSETGVVVPCLVVKGISDLGDDGAFIDKVAKQKAATSNAAKVVLRLISEQ